MRGFLFKLIDMPHFIIDCSKEVLSNISQKEVNTKIHQTAVASGLFDESDIKVRMRPFENYMVGGSDETLFIHVFAYVMEGRTTEQKANLSKSIVAELKSLFPEVPFIAMNIYDFEKATYANLSTI